MHRSISSVAKGTQIAKPDRRKQSPRLVSSIVMRKDPLADIGADRLAWLIGLASEVDDSMLAEIAQADYGMDADEHLAHLKNIRDNQIFDVPLGWCPKEVLGLIRWSEPEDPSWKPGSTGLRGHLMRAFSCASLLYAASMPENFELFEGENQTIAQLLDSLRHINNPAHTKEAAKLIAYLLENCPEKDEERPFEVLALLVLALRARASEKLIGDLAAWVIEEEQTIRNAPWAVLPDDDAHWLLGLTFFDMRHNRWIEMGGELRDWAEKLTDERVKRMVMWISEKLRIAIR